MVTGELRRQVDKVWDAFWSGGIANPVEVIEQFRSPWWYRNPRVRLFRGAVAQAGAALTAARDSSEESHLSIIRGIEIKLPSLDVQADCAKQIALLTAVRLRFEARLVALDSLFASLQHRAFRGEL